LEYLKDVQLVLSLEDLDSVVDSIEYDVVVQVFSQQPVINQDDVVKQICTPSYEVEVGSKNVLLQNRGLKILK